MSDIHDDSKFSSEPERVTFDLPEVGRLLGVSRSAVYRWAAAGKIRTIKVGRRVLVPRSAVEALINEPLLAGSHTATDDSGAGQTPSHLMSFARMRGVDLDLTLHDPLAREIERLLAELTDSQFRSLLHPALDVFRPIDEEPVKRAYWLLAILPLLAEQARRR